MCLSEGDYVHIGGLSYHVCVCLRGISVDIILPCVCLFEGDYLDIVTKGLPRVCLSEGDYLDIVTIVVCVCLRGIISI